MRRPADLRELPRSAGSMSVLVVAGQRVFPVGIPEDGELVVGSGPQADIRLDDARVAGRHLSLRHGGEGLVEVRDLKAAGTLLNEVQLSGGSSARAGDEIRLGGSLLLVQGPAAVPGRKASAVGFGELEGRLAIEVARSRAHQRALAFILVQLPGSGSDGQQAILEQLSETSAGAVVGASWASFGGDILALLCPEASAAALEEVKDRVISALGQSGHRFKLGQALYPDDGADGDELIESAVAKLLGPVAVAADEPVLADPVMVRLFAILERLAHSDAPLLLEGPPGVGKQTLARALHHREGRSAAPLRVLRCAALRPADLDAALGRSRGSTLFLDRLDELGPELEAKLAGDLASIAKVRVLASTAGARALPGELKARFASMRVVLPALASRRADVLPLADHFLGRSRKALGRPGLTFSGEARRALAEYPWPGNVRELKNAVERAALTGAGNELGLDELPVRVVREAAERGAGAGNLRASLRATEKDVLLRALLATRWNVTAAAKDLGVPRRTVVYRLARLGLRRPKR